MKRRLLVMLLGVTVGAAAWIGGFLASRPAESPRVSVKPTPAVSPVAAAPLMADPEAADPHAVVSVPSLREGWSSSTTFEEKDRIAATLAERSSAESVQALLDGINHTSDWSERAALAKNLRAVSDPETLAVLVPALLDNYGRGSSILGEIVDVIARLAQPETIEDLAALHWQASTQAGQGHKVLRAVAAIRNPSAKRGLERLVARSDSPALSAAAQEAIKVMQEKEAGQATEQ